MKKLYSLLFSLLLCGTVSAQDLSLTVDDVAVANKSTATIVYNCEAFEKIPGMPFLGMDYGFYPKVMLTSKIDQDVLVTLRDESHDQGTQFCYGGTCDELYNMNYQSSKSSFLKADKAQDLQIHVKHNEAATDKYEVKLLLDAYGTVDGESFSCTLLLKYDPEATGLDSVTKIASSVYFNMNGQQVSSPRRGVYVRNGRKVVIR